MAEKETFYIKFQMHGGDSIEITEERDAGYNFRSVLKAQEDKWYENGSRIINLDNVNSIVIETKTQREEREKRDIDGFLAAAEVMAETRF
nr:hypothetical protein 6 [bacterium]